MEVSTETDMINGDDTTLSNNKPSESSIFVSKQIETEEKDIDIINNINNNHRDNTNLDEIMNHKKEKEEINDNGLEVNIVENTDNSNDIDIGNNIIPSRSISPQSPINHEMNIDLNLENDANQNGAGDIVHSPINQPNEQNHEDSVGSIECIEMIDAEKNEKNENVNFDDIENTEESDHKNNAENVKPEYYKNTDNESNQMEIENEMKNENENEIENKNENEIENGSGIGTELEMEKQDDKNKNDEQDDDKHNERDGNDGNDKMDIDDEDESNHNQQQQQQQQQQKEDEEDEKINNPNEASIDIKNVQQTDGINNYIEELDEDFNVDAEEEDDDDDDDEEDEEEDDDESGEHSEVIVDDDEDENDGYSTEIGDIDIVHDDKIYTEEAPRWLHSIDDGDEFNVEIAYQNWELDKLNHGTIYSDRSEDADDENNNDGDDVNDEMNGEGFFNNLLLKYGTRQREDPAKDKINKKGKNEYKLDDKFIDDDDCFEQNGAETVHGGFFIARGHIDVKKVSLPISSLKPKPKTGKRKYVNKPLPDIPETYQKHIETIQNAVKSNQTAMGYIIKDRYMNPITHNKQNYIKFCDKKIDDEDKENMDNGIMYEDDIINTYESLLLMLLEFDLILLRNKISSKLRVAIFKQLSETFEWDTHESPRKQQINFEELLNWFSFDWFDDPKQERKAIKLNWRSMFLEVLKKRSRARFANKLNIVRKKENKDGGDKEGDKGKKEQFVKRYQPAEIPWDSINPEIFLMTRFSMEIAGINETDMDIAAHQCHLNLHQSLGKYLEGGTNAIKMANIEKKYNEYLKQPFINPRACYSHLVIQRIKEQKRNTKKQKKKVSPKKSKKLTPKQSPNQSPNQSPKPSVISQGVVDLTSNDNNNDNQHEIDQNEQNMDIDNDDNQQPLVKQQTLHQILNNHIKQQSVIDLTGNDSITSNTMYSTPSTQILIPKQTRKRRFHQIDQELTQNTSSQNTSQNSSPPPKRRKLNGNNAFNEIDHEIKENGIHQLKYPNPETFLNENSLIAVQKSVDSLKDGAVLSVIHERISQRISCIDYQTGDCLTNDGNLNSYYFIVPYIDKRNYLTSNIIQQNLSGNSVLALEIKEYGPNSIVFGTKYKLAQITLQPKSMDNDIMNDGNYYSDQCLIGIRYEDNNNNNNNNNDVEIPLYTLIESSSSSNVDWQNIKIPTVIKIIPVIATMIGKQFQCESNKHIEDGNNVTVIHYDPPSSDRFCRNLPSDPWGDQHFQGDNN